MKRWYNILWIALVVLPCKAQQKVVSAQGVAVSYVNIGIVGTSRGLISNERGEFYLERLHAKPTDSIYFSHISYDYKVLLARDIKDRIVLHETTIKLPETSFSLKKSKEHILRSKGIRALFTLCGDIKETFSPEEGSVLNAELGDFFKLEKDTKLTEFSIDILKSELYMAKLRVVVYATDSQHKTFTPLHKEPIYIEIFPSVQSQTFTEKLSIFAPKGEVWVGVQFVEMRGKDEDTLYFPSTINTCYIRYPDGKIRPVNKRLGIPFSIKGYDYEVLGD
jgi:hypothetical protein